MKVKVYRNLQKRCFSVMDASTRRVIDHAHEVHIIGATFHVSQAGRARVLREKRKNVHAFVDGLRLAELPEEDLSAIGWRRARYNPYMADHFQDSMTGERIDSAELVSLRGDGIWYINFHQK